MKREYFALVEGRIKEDNGVIDKPLGRNKKDRLKIGIVPDGRRAVTHYEVLERFNSTTLIKCVLETGRTHQIRVHMAEIGHPVVGDMVYSNGKNEFGIEGQMLHAYKLDFKHPVTEKEMNLEAPLPDYFVNVLKQLEKLKEN